MRMLRILLEMIYTVAISFLNDICRRNKGVSHVLQTYAPFTAYYYIIGNIINFFLMTFPAPIFAACKRRIYLAKIVRILRRIIVNGRFICRLP